jgi:hypothetical protein
MQITVLSVKLPAQSDLVFEHEFRAVHAQATTDMAALLGVIERYVQGISLVHAKGASAIQRPPLPEATVPLQAFAQLTWPSVEVLQSALKSSGYKNSAGKHVFATSQHVFLTNRLEEDTGSSVDRAWPVGTASVRPVLLVMALSPKEGLDDATFRTAWDKHATRWRGLGAAYQRNLALPLTRPQVEAVLGGTAFTPGLCALRGGYEEFSFASGEAAQKFVDDHGAALQQSYASFCGNGSYFAGFDRVVPYQESDRGPRQKLMARVIRTVFAITRVLGVSV